MSHRSCWLPSLQWYEVELNPVVALQVQALISSLCLGEKNSDVVNVEFILELSERSL